MNIQKISECVREFKEGDMRVPARIYANQKLFDAMEEGVFRQAGNVAKLPGIQKASLVMPDGHFGYGFPIGGVAGFDMDEGIISPGGVGYDINCGVRLLTTNLTVGEIRPKIRELIERLFKNIPSGVGSKGRLRLSEAELDDAVTLGARWAVENGYGREDDLAHIEENGQIQAADPACVGNKAKQRGLPQFGTLGSGNHFLEIQFVESIYDDSMAGNFGINPLSGNEKRRGDDRQVTVMVHCGSRGFGHQIADDYIGIMLSAAKKYNISLPDKELACAPIKSPEAEKYISAMRCAVNYAFANREIITHWVRETFVSLFRDIEIDLVYDVCHNIAKFEKHKVDNEMKMLCVHRKGATRAFPAGRDEVPQTYRKVGQPVIVPGDMGTASYLLVGTEKAMDETFGSVCHGAGRVMSRAAAVRKFRGSDVKTRMESQGKYVKAVSLKVLAEEVSQAYKDIDQVIKSVESAGISKTVARVVPLGVVKG